MKVIKQITVTDDKLASASVAENDYAAWEAATSYLIGAMVIRTETHRIYKCVVAGVDSTTPEDSVVSVTPRWVDMGPTNRWAMLDGIISTQTISATTIEYVFNISDIIDSVCLFGLVGSSITIKAEVDELGDMVEVYNMTKSLDSSYISDWYQYFTTPFYPIKEAFFTDLPMLSEMVITVTIVGTYNVRCGLITFGTMTDLGSTQYRAKFGMTDHSIKTTDEFGNAIYVKRNKSKRLEIPLQINNFDLNTFWNFMDSIDGPCVWLGSDDDRYVVLSTYGFFKDFDVDIEFPEVSYCTLQIEGLI
jgi:hypothetical protein